MKLLNSTRWKTSILYLNNLGFTFTATLNVSSFHLLFDVWIRLVRGVPAEESLPHGYVVGLIHIIGHCTKEQCGGMSCIWTRQSTCDSHTYLYEQVVCGRKVPSATRYSPRWNWQRRYTMSVSKKFGKKHWHIPWTEVTWFNLSPMHSLRN